MDHPQTPRVLQPHLSQFQHRIVRILGKVVQLRGEEAVIDAGGNIDVILNRVCFPFLSQLRHFFGPELVLTGFAADKDAHLTVGHAVEVIGKVDGNLAVKVQAATDFGTNVGMLASFFFSPFRSIPRFLS